MTYGKQPELDIDYIMKRVEVEGDCWMWQVGLNTDGYGGAWRSGKNHLAHRYVYEFLVGSIAEGMTLDHLCRVRNCVNPDHLEAVTNRENIRRGRGHAGINARKTSCKRGHAFTKENTRMTPQVYRVCRACHRRNENKRFAERKK